MNKSWFEKISFEFYKKKLMIFLIFLSIAFSLSLPVYKYFDTSNSVDPKSYLKMSQGDYDVNPTHRYRFVIPKMVKVIKPYIQKINFQISGEQNDIENFYTERLGFFIVNLTISSITAYYTFFYLKSLGFCYLNSLVGGILFLSNRYVILSNGAPLIDSLQYLCLILYSSYLLNKETIKISFLLPIMGIAKETLIPLILVPFFERKINKKFIFFSIIISIVLLVFIRSHINNSDYEITKNLYQDVFEHLIKFPKRISVIFSIKGFLKIFSTYGVLLIFSIIGFFVNEKEKDFVIPNNIKLLVPYSISLCFLSNDTGRLISIAFPVIIPYSLYFINKKILINKFIFR